jgi:hypothetical protein
MTDNITPLRPKAKDATGAPSGRRDIARNASR